MTASRRFNGEPIQLDGWQQADISNSGSNSPLETFQNRPPFAGSSEETPLTWHASDSQSSDHTVGERLKSTFKQRTSSWVMISATLLWLTFTVFFAYNATLGIPLFDKLVFAPTTTITVLNILSHVTVVLLQFVTSDVFEAVRWALASSQKGISSFAFLALSRATSPMGVLYLIQHNSPDNSDNRVITGHRFWSAKRYSTFLVYSNSRLVFIALEASIGTALLYHVSFRTYWHQVYEFKVDVAGLSPLNTSLAAGFQFFFWVPFLGVLEDTTSVASIPPLWCSGIEANCSAYFFSGGLRGVSPNPYALQDHPEADGFVVHDSPGYQMEFASLEQASFSSSDCQLYGYHTAAILICFAQSGNGHVAGYSTFEFSNLQD
jgi:hypothetical protein